MAATAEKRTDDEVVEAQRAAEARHLLEHPMLNGALTAIEEEWDREWKGSNPGDVKTREFAYRMLYTARKFRALLTKIVDSGNLADAAHLVRANQAELLEKE
jgi:hypothetical protein